MLIKNYFRLLGRKLENTQSNGLCRPKVLGLQPNKIIKFLIRFNITGNKTYFCNRSCYIAERVTYDF